MIFTSPERCQRVHPSYRLQQPDTYGYIYGLIQVSVLYTGSNPNDKEECCDLTRAMDRQQILQKTWSSKNGVRKREGLCTATETHAMILIIGHDCCDLTRAMDRQHTTKKIGHHTRCAEESYAQPRRPVLMIGHDEISMQFDPADLFFFFPFIQVRLAFYIKGTNYNALHRHEFH